MPRAAVRQDYIDFLMEQDGLSHAAAAAQIDATPAFVETWFAEQCNYWGDVETMGRLVATSTLFKTKKALDRVRGGRHKAIPGYERVGDLVPPGVQADSLQADALVETGLPAPEPERQR